MIVTAIAVLTTVCVLLFFVFCFFTAEGALPHLLDLP